MPDTTETVRPDEAQSEERQRALNAAITRQKVDDKGPAPAEAEGNAVTSPLSGEVDVEWEPGVVRKVKVEDLVQAAKSKADIEAAKRAVALGAAEAAVMEQLKQLSEEDRAVIMDGIRDPSRLRQKPPQRTEDDDLTDILGMDEKRTNGHDDPRWREIEEMKQVVQAIAQHVSEDLNQKAKSTMATRVAEEMSGYTDAFPRGSELSNWAKDSIMTEIALDPKQDLGELVAKTAARALKLRGVDRETRKASPTTAGPSEMPRGLTADELQGGQSLSRVSAFLDKLHRR